jgi:hypothetical protein
VDNLIWEPFSDPDSPSIPHPQDQETAPLIDATLAGPNLQKKHPEHFFNSFLRG